LKIKVSGMANAEAQFFRISGLKLSTPHALFS